MISASSSILRVQRGELSLLRLNYQLAIEHFAQAVEIVPVSYPEVRAQYRWSYASALYKYGEDQGINGALRDAINTLQSLAIYYSRETNPPSWAAAQNNLGTALSTLGQRESGMSRLEEAVAAYRDALLERTRERVPLDWATVQNNLGNTLWTLGERESGTARLEEAVAAYRDALLERTRERVPLQWAGDDSREP